MQNRVKQFLREFRMCDRKIAFVDTESAERKAEYVLERYGATQRPYNCPKCGYIHLKTVESGK